MPTIPDSSPVDSLVSGTQRFDADGVVTVHFVGAGQTPAKNGFYEVSDGWSAFERARAEAAFATIAAVTNLTFEVTNDPNADFQLVLNTRSFDGPNSLGYFYEIFGRTNVGVFNSDGYGWTSDGLRAGGLGFTTMVHEFLHGLGLDHPHDGDRILSGVTEPFFSYGRSELNQGIWTAMSYNGGYNRIRSNSDNFGFEFGPMAFDIALLQQMYGANMSHNTGGNTYMLDNSNSDGAGWQAIWDAGGNDTMQYSGSRDAVIDLRAATLDYNPGGGGFVSVASGIKGGFTIANGVVIENGVGGSGDDRMIGNAANNSLSGNAGNDFLLGGAGADDLNGGADRDTLRGGTGDDDLSAGSGNDQLSGDAGADTLVGDSGTNVLNGGSGADTLIGGTGRDTLNGGGGNDLLQGAAANDVLNGGRGADTLDGGSGADVLLGGMGADQLTGGADNDRFVFNFLSDSWAGAGSRDTILDFVSGADVIDVSGIDADLVDAGDQAFTVITTGFTNTAGELRFADSGADTIVQIDRNGDGLADMEIAVLGLTSLTADDFIL